MEVAAEISNFVFAPPLFPSLAQASACTLNKKNTFLTFAFD